MPPHLLRRLHPRPPRLRRAQLRRVLQAAAGENLGGCWRQRRRPGWPRPAGPAPVSRAARHTAPTTPLPPYRSCPTDVATPLSPHHWYHTTPSHTTAATQRNQLHHSGNTASASPFGQPPHDSAAFLAWQLPRMVFTPLQPHHSHLTLTPKPPRSKKQASASRLSRLLAWLLPRRVHSTSLQPRTTPPQPHHAHPTPHPQTPTNLIQDSGGSLSAETLAGLAAVANS